MNTSSRPVYLDYSANTPADPAILHRFPACRLHVDATQAIGKIPFDFSCADTASFAPHKFYGLCSFRVSLSHLTTQEALSAFMERFTQCYQELTQ